MKAAEALGEATRTGRPAVVVVCCVLLLLVLVSMWLWRARRPVPTPRGKLTVRDLQARLDYEVQAEIEQARLAEFRRTAEEAAAERAEADTEVVPRVGDPAFPEAEKPRKGRSPTKLGAVRSVPPIARRHRDACPSLARHATSPWLGQALSSV